jgi:excisionase family DNA binding protein
MTADPTPSLLADLEHLAATLNAVIEHQREQPDIRPLLLDAGQLAVVLGISESGAFKVMQKRTLPGVIRIGKTVRISRAAVERWIEEQSEKEPTRLRRAG